MNDLRYGLRQLLRSPGFTAVVVLSLGLGIGANVAVFTWIESLLLRPLPGVAKQEDLVVLTTSHGEKMWDTLSLADIRDVAAMKHVFSGVCGSQMTPASLTVDGTAEWTYGQPVSASFFDVLGVKPVLGRTFQPDEEVKPGGHPVLVIRETLWRRRFGGDPGIIGKTVELNRHAFTIVGVVPAGFPGDTTGLNCEFWAPLMMNEEVTASGHDNNQILQRYARWFHTYARLQPGVTVADAQAALATLSVQLEQSYPNTNRDIRLHAAALPDSTYGAQALFRPLLGLLLAVSVGVLLIVSANVANLLLARVTTRQGEIAVRLAVGASRARILRQFLIESLVLAVLGGLFGVIAAYWLVDLFALFIPRTALPIALHQEIDARVMLAAVAVTLVAGVLFGLLPALHASRPNLGQALKESGRSGDASGHRRARSALVVVEISLALVLLVGAGLCFRGLRQTEHIDVGLDAEGVMLVGLRVGMHGYTPETAPALFRTLRQRLAAAPGIDSVALANWFPLGFEDTGSSGVEVVGQPQPAGQPLTFRRAIISPGYFETLRIPVVAGRDFTDQDDRSTQRVAIVNETFARRFWPEQEAVGRRIKIEGRERTIVGVVKAGKYRALNDPPEPFFYLPSGQSPWVLDLGLCVRATQGDAVTLTRVIRETLRETAPDVNIWQVLPLRDYVQAAVTPQRIAATLLMVVSAIALGLAAMGVYAVMDYSVRQQHREIGIRMALGATARDVLWHVSRRGLMLTATGIVVGLVCASWGSHLLAGFLQGVSRFDLLTFALVPLLLASVASLACYIPARRAAKADPLRTLRAE